jgi:hypothetical protein
MGNKTPSHKNGKQPTEVKSNKITSKETIHSHEPPIPFNHANISIDTFKIILYYLSPEEKRILCITSKQFFGLYYRLTFGILMNHGELNQTFNSFKTGFENRLGKFIKEYPNFDSYMFLYTSHPNRMVINGYLEPHIDSIQYGSIRYGDLLSLYFKKIKFQNLKYLFINDSMESYNTYGLEDGIDMVGIIKFCFPNLRYLNIRYCSYSPYLDAHIYRLFPSRTCNLRGFEFLEGFHSLYKQWDKFILPSKMKFFSTDLCPFGIEIEGDEGCKL